MDNYGSQSVVLVSVTVVLEGASNELSLAVHTQEFHQMQSCIMFYSKVLARDSRHESGFKTNASQVYC